MVRYMKNKDETDDSEGLSGLPTVKYVCDKCGDTSEFTMITGYPLEYLPCKCGGKRKLER
mgnify:CR=1 FL=1